MQERRAAAWTRMRNIRIMYACTCTHTTGNLDLELVKDLLNGLHVGLQVFGFRRDTGQRRGQNRVQVELQDAVHSVAGKRRLERCESARMHGTHVLSID